VLLLRVSKLNMHESENLPPAFAEAASRRQVAPLCQRGVKNLPLAKGGWEGFYK